MPAFLTNSLDFPDAHHADSDGLVAIGGDLQPARLLAAYRQGIYPWSIHPLTWWSPDPRGIIKLDDFHVSKSLAKFIRKGAFETTIDKAFREVIHACAAPGQNRRQTWISPEFIEAYIRACPRSGNAWRTRGGVRSGRGAEGVVFVEGGQIVRL